jgi:hypothetical protein
MNKLALEFTMPRREPVTVMKAVTPARQGNFKLRLNGARKMLIGLSPFYVYAFSY